MQLFLLIGDDLAYLVLDDVDLRLDSHREVDPLVDVQQYCKGQKKRLSSCKHGVLAGIGYHYIIFTSRGLSQGSALVSEEDSTA